MKPKKIPINVAKEIAKKYNFTQVVITAFNGEVGGYHVTTYGTNKEQCKQAAKAGDFVKNAIGGSWS